jgi:hypothetical protein
MTSNFGGFHQPIIFVFGSSEGGVILWIGRTMPLPGCKKTLGASFFATDRFGFIS